MMEIIEKPWGREEVLEINNHYMVKRLYMKKGFRCSLQYHRYKRETIVVISGSLLVTHDNLNMKPTWEDLVLEPGDCFTIPTEKIHRMKGITDVVYLEASTPELNDVIRIKDDYGR